MSCKCVWKVGDVVAIKSGSPKMTIVKITGRNAECIYSNYKDNQIVRINVPIECLSEPPTIDRKYPG